jgi:hypothetical protein
VGVFRGQASSAVGALVKDAEAIEAINGFGDDKWVNGVFSHPAIFSHSTGFHAVFAFYRRLS